MERGSSSGAIGISQFQLDCGLKTAFSHGLDRAFRGGSVKAMRFAVRNISILGRWGRSGFTLAEVMVGVGFLLSAVVALYLAFSTGFGFVQLTRENLRATQILTEKLETIRLYTWDQLNTPGFVPTSFTATFFPPSTTNSGIAYSGTMQILAAPVTETYSNEIRLVEVEVRWNSGKSERRRSMTTLVSQYGIQNYKPN